MGRKRKVVDQNCAANEDKASNASSDAKSGVENLHSHAENSQAMEAMNVKNHEHLISNGVKLEMSSRAGSVVVRRSPRFNSLASLTKTKSHGAEPLVEHINLVENEQAPEVQQDCIPPDLNGRTLEEKVDYLIRAADYFKSKDFKGEDEVPGPEISYKSLYLDSQKKIEALMNDNYELVKKLEFARGKNAAYEVMKDALGAQKEFFLVSALGKAADIAASLSPKASTPTPPAGSPHGAGDPKPRKSYKKRARW